MSVSGKTELDNLIPDIWSPMMYDELRNSIIFGNIFSRQFEGDIKNLGDTVKVNQIVAPTAEVLTDDKAQFASQAMSVSQYSVTVNRRYSAAFEITDLAQLQSLEVGAQIREALVYAVRLKLENDIITALVASASNPDHQISPASAGTLAAADLGTIRGLLSTAKVPLNDRYLVLSPSYFSDLLNASTVTSQDFVAGNSAESGVLSKFMGFQIMEHNLLGTDVGYAVHPSALQLCLQQEMRLKLSDLHSQNKYGYLLSADILCGYTLFDDDRIVKISG